MQIQLNGQEKQVPANCSLQQLLELLTLKPERLAIELNRMVVRRAQWAETQLQPADQVEIVHFVGGG